MKRNSSAIADDTFDVFIIGGGIYGAWSAYFCALAGLKTAIVDKADWANGTSSASTKLIHGGLRYLENLHLNLVRKSVLEREFLQKAAPHRVHPQRFVIPQYGQSRFQYIKIKTGLTVYDAIAGKHLAARRHSRLTAEEMHQRNPLLKKDDLNYGLGYFDSQTNDARLVLEIIDGAMSFGACAVNYAQVNHIEKTNVFQIQLTDRISKQEITTRSKIIINAAGPWLNPLLPTKFQGQWIPRLTKGIHLVLDQNIGDDAYLLRAPQDNRVFFAIPYFNKTLLGTTDTDWSGNADDIDVSDQDIAYMLDAFQHYFPQASTNIINVFAGLRVLPQSAGKSESAVTRDWLGEEIDENYWLSFGGKITSARTDVLQMVRAILRKNWPSNSNKLIIPDALPWSPGLPFDRWYDNTRESLKRIGIDSFGQSALPKRYGNKMDTVIEYLTNDKKNNTQIFPGYPFYHGELGYLRDHEMVTADADIWHRRLEVSKLVPDFDK
jgi:glycerol-3-phosphate dehydrogenase